MEKLVFRSFLLLTILASSASMAVPGIYLGCTEGGGCTRTVVGGGGGSATIGGGNTGRIGDSGGAGRAAAAKAALEKKCAQQEAAKAGIPTDVQECKLDANYALTTKSAECSGHGKVTWSFNYSGEYMTSTFTSAQVQARGPYDSTCQSMMRAAHAATVGGCDISGQRAQQSIDNACAALKK